MLVGAGLRITSITEHRTARLTASTNGILINMGLDLVKIKQLGAFVVLSVPAVDYANLSSFYRDILCLIY